MLVDKLILPFQVFQLLRRILYRRRLFLIGFHVPLNGLEVFDFRAQPYKLLLCLCERAGKSAVQYSVQNKVKGILLLRHVVASLSSIPRQAEKLLRLISRQAGGNFFGCFRLFLLVQFIGGLNPAAILPKRDAQPIQRRTAVMPRQKDTLLSEPKPFDFYSARSKKPRAFLVMA